MTQEDCREVVDEFQRQAVFLMCLEATNEKNRQNSMVFVSPPFSKRLSFGEA